MHSEPFCGNGGEAHTIHPSRFLPASPSVAGPQGCLPSHPGLPLLVHALLLPTLSHYQPTNISHLKTVNKPHTPRMSSAHLLLPTQQNDPAALSPPHLPPPHCHPAITLPFHLARNKGPMSHAPLAIILWVEVGGVDSRVPSQHRPALAWSWATEVGMDGPSP